jgi:hypothetical protein
MLTVCIMQKLGSNLGNMSSATRDALKVSGMYVAGMDYTPESSGQALVSGLGFIPRTIYAMMGKIAFTVDLGGHGFVKIPRPSGVVGWARCAHARCDNARGAHCI